VDALAKLVISRSALAPVAAAKTGRYRVPSDITNPKIKLDALLVLVLCPTLIYGLIAHSSAINRTALAAVFTLRKPVLTHIG